MFIYALFISVVHTRSCIFHGAIPVGFGIICIGCCDKRRYILMREGKSQHTPSKTKCAPLYFVEGTVLVKTGLKIFLDKRAK
jgi:hypothetical protein